MKFENINSKKAKDLVEKGAILIDVRSRNERDLKRIEGDVFAPLDLLEEELKNCDLSSGAVFYCAAGVRSAKAAAKAKEIYPDFDFFSIDGGIESVGDDFSLVQDISLSADDYNRYSRQILLPELGVKGQKSLLSKRALIVGLGGLGSPAAFYLGAAGVSLGLVDDDVVDESNLQRQIIHKQEAVGTLKVESARESLMSLNSQISVETYKERLDYENAEEIISGYDVVLDGADNFKTRYLINDVSRKLNIPVVSASILGFWGQITTFASDGPCYRCIYPSPPPPELAPSCSAAGVIGAVAGILGTYQANEAIKILAEIGDTLSGKLMIFELLENRVQVLNVGRDTSCPVCSGKDLPLEEIDDLCRV